MTGAGRGQRPGERAGAAARPPSSPPARAGGANAAPAPRARRPWAWIGALAILPLLWSSRGPTLGVPVADDYIFLDRLARGGGLDWFGPMGAAYYWRPLGRQAYYLLLGPWLPRAPWLGTVVAALLLLALYLLLYRLARHRFDPAVAAAIASFPLLAEPARVLLLWPSAAQHLLAAVLVALALERAASGRMAAAGAAALGALLSNEAAALALPALPLIAWSRTHDRRAAARWGALATAVAVAWLTGYALARGAGARAPVPAPGALSWTGVLATVVQGFAGQLGTEGLRRGGAAWLLGAVALLAAAALACSLAPPARRRLARAAPVLVGGAAWFVAGAAPLALLLPDWNAWRTTVAGLGLAFALPGWLALAWRPLVGGLVALRVAALLIAPPAPGIVSEGPPRTASSFSFARLVRLQRIVASTRGALRAAGPLRRGATVRYWTLPRLAEVGFAGSRALQVWTGDTTASWRPLGGDWDAPRDLLIEYEESRAWPATVIDEGAVATLRESWRHMDRNDLQAADSLAWEAARRQPGSGSSFHALCRLAASQAAYLRGDYGRAEKLLAGCGSLAHTNSEYWSMSGLLALRRRDFPAARDAAARSLRIDPRNAMGVWLAGVTRASP